MVLQKDQRKRTKKQARPDYLHLRNGVWYFRRGVPADARAAFGRTEVLVSLRTGNVAEARHLALPELAKYEATLSGVRGVVPPAERVVHPVARPTADELTSAVRTWLRARNARSQERIDALSGADEDQMQMALRSERIILDGISVGEIAPTLDTDWIASQLIDEHGWSIKEGDPEYRRLRRLIGQGRVEANETATRLVLEAPPHVIDKRFDLSLEPTEAAPSGMTLSLAGMYDDWVAERQPAPATQTGYKKAWKDFRAFVKHDDARRVTPKNVLDWKSDLKRVQESGKVRADRTVRDKYLTPVKSIFSCAVEGQRLAENPAAKVGMRVKKTPRLHGSDAFTDAEAKLILAATLRPPPSNISSEMASARRWVPWLCAYTGARVGEVTQLRSEDVLEVEGGFSHSDNARGRRNEGP